MAIKLFGISLKRSVPLCAISDVRPCKSSGALEIFAPYAAPITCSPKQIPRIGIPASSQYLTASILTPAFWGFPGPGDITTPAKFLQKSGSIASFLTTTVVAPSSSRYCTMLNTKESWLSTTKIFLPPSNPVLMWQLWCNLCPCLSHHYVKKRRPIFRKRLLKQSRSQPRAQSG